MSFRLLICVVTIIMTAGVASADIVTVVGSGQSANYHSPFTESFSLMFTYETSTPATGTGNPETYEGVLTQFHLQSGPLSIDILPTSPLYSSEILVTNDPAGDRLEVSLSGPDTFASLILFDSRGTALGSTALPTSFSLDQFDSPEFGMSFGENGSLEAVSFTSLHASVIPAPGAAALGFIGLGLVGRIKRRLA